MRADISTTAWASKRPPAGCDALKAALEPARAAASCTCKPVSRSGNIILRTHDLKVGYPGNVCFLLRISSCTAWRPPP